MQNAARRDLDDWTASDRPEAEVDLPDLLLRISREVAGMAGQVQRLQTSLSGFLVANADWVLVEEAQALDHVCQHMNELAGVVRRIASHAEGQSVPVDPVLEGVLLSGLIRRLCGRSEETAGSGEMELL